MSGGNNAKARENPVLFTACLEAKNAKQCFWNGANPIAQRAKHIADQVASGKKPNMNMSQSRKLQEEFLRKRSWNSGRDIDKYLSLSIESWVRKDSAEACFEAALQNPPGSISNEALVQVGYGSLVGSWERRPDGAGDAAAFLFPPALHPALAAQGFALAENQKWMNTLGVRIQTDGGQGSRSLEDVWWTDPTAPAPP